MRKWFIWKAFIVIFYYCMTVFLLLLAYVCYDSQDWLRFLGASLLTVVWIIGSIMQTVGTVRYWKEHKI